MHFQQDTCIHRIGHIEPLCRCPLRSPDKKREEPFRRAATEWGAGGSGGSGDRSVISRRLPCPHVSHRSPTNVFVKCTNAAQKRRNSDMRLDENLVNVLRVDEKHSLDRARQPVRLRDRKTGYVSFGYRFK